MSRRRKRKMRAWVPPGTLYHDPSAPEPIMDVIAFSSKEVVEKPLDAVTWIVENKDKYPVLWINVDGLGDTALVADLGRIFHLHPLSLEDVLNVTQRPKVDVYDDYYFITLRMLHRMDRHIETEQLSIFLGRNFVITFQEGIPGDCLEPVRERIRKDSTRLRAGAPDFLVYHLIDAVVDGYFPVLEELGERLEFLENLVLVNPTRRIVQEIHDIKRDLIVIRRATWPLREAINPLFRDETAMIKPETRVFLRDAYDHCIQVVELVESYRELGSSLMDIYLSSLSNRMNEVMKVLTMMTTIFTPLTFIVGVYGMNFNTEKSPFNMPELNARYGYPACVLVMVSLSVLQLVFFWHKGWLFGSRDEPIEYDLPKTPTPETHSPSGAHHAYVAPPSGAHRAPELPPGGSQVSQPPS